MKRFLRLILVLAVLTTTAGCGRKTEYNSSAGKGVTTTVDSAAMLMELVDHYYKSVEHDSLAGLAPVAMDYFSRYNQWQQYYTTWCLLVNDMVWNGQMDQGLEEARKMHHDAIKRNNAFGLSEAYTALGIAYHFQNNHKESAACYQQALKYFHADADHGVKLNIYSYYCQVLVESKDFETTERVMTEWKLFLDNLTGGKAENAEDAHRYFRFHRENYKYHYARGRYRLAASEPDVMQRFLEKENDRELYEAQVAGFRTHAAKQRATEGG